LGHIRGKEVKTGRMKEKNKKGGFGRGRLPPYLVGTVFLYHRDATGFDLLASPSAGAACCGHALSYAPLCCLG
jgi:hypothetical protein